MNEPSVTPRHRSKLLSPELWTVLITVAGVSAIVWGAISEPAPPAAAHRVRADVGACAAAAASAPGGAASAAVARDKCEADKAAAALALGAGKVAWFAISSAFEALVK